MHAQQELIPETAFQGLVGQLPADLGLGSPRRRPSGAIGSCRQLIRDIADELHVDEHDAAFYARIAFESSMPSARVNVNSVRLEAMELAAAAASNLGRTATVRRWREQIQLDG